MNLSTESARESVVLSHLQVAPLIAAYHAGSREAEVSPDLGWSTTTVALDAAGAHFSPSLRLNWTDAARIRKSDRKCFVLREDGFMEASAFSPTTGWVRSLCPTSGAPTMLVSGIPMHRIKNTEPHADTLTKIAAIMPITGRVLDTATGLGYTAIEAARAATSVVTIELDPTAIDIARLNPWSRELFDNPHIEQCIGDTFEIASQFDDALFTRVIHDPPTFALAGELYSAAFYRTLHRILARGGRLFHYIGDPSSVSGKRATNGVMRRLAEAGFERVVRRSEAFGVVAYR